MVNTARKNGIAGKKFCIKFTDPGSLSTTGWWRIELKIEENGAFRVQVAKNFIDPN